jgi:hypothetical protein
LTRCASIDGVAIPVTVVKKIASMSSGATPAREMACRKLVSDSSLATATNASLAEPKPLSSS